MILKCIFRTRKNLIFAKLSPSPLLACKDVKIVLSSPMLEVAMNILENNVLEILWRATAEISEEMQRFI